MRADHAVLRRRPCSGACWPKKAVFAGNLVVDLGARRRASSAADDEEILRDEVPVPVEEQVREWVPVRDAEIVRGQQHRRVAEVRVVGTARVEQEGAGRDFSGGDRAVRAGHRGVDAVRQVGEVGADRPVVPVLAERLHGVRARSRVAARGRTAVVGIEGAFVEAHPEGREEVALLRGEVLDANDHACVVRARSARDEQAEGHSEQRAVHHRILSRRLESKRRVMDGPGGLPRLPSRGRSGASRGEFHPSSSVQRPSQSGAVARGRTHTSESRPEASAPLASGYAGGRGSVARKLRAARMLDRRGAGGGAPRERVEMRAGLGGAVSAWRASAGPQRGGSASPASPHVRSEDCKACGGARRGIGPAARGIRPAARGMGLAGVGVGPAARGARWRRPQPASGV